MTAAIRPVPPKHQLGVLDEAVSQSFAHPASPVARRGSDVRILTRRGWRTARHLNDLAAASRANGLHPATAFNMLGLV